MRLACHFRYWPQAAVERCLLFRRCQWISRHLANGPRPPVLTQMYGPAACCKRFSSIRQLRSCINVSGLRLERVVLRAIMDISAHAI